MGVGSVKSLFSQSWYRVAGLKPQLRGHTRFHHHVYRGTDWYVLQDLSTGRFYRFSREAYLVIGLMDGERTMDEIWEGSCETLGDDMATQDEAINLLSYLHQSDLLQSDMPPDMADLGHRSRKERRQKWLARVKSPAAMNFALWDPDRFLSHTAFLARPFTGPLGAVVWSLVLLVGLLLLSSHWKELATDVTDRVLSMENLLLLAFIYPVSRLLHEMGHAYAVKRWGGEVHELGIMLVVFMPLPYVDASWSSAFPSKWRRMLVGAAGILVDLFLAALAMIVWSVTEPGAARAVAYNVLFVSGLSTLLLNGNPLIRFDSYYVLTDFLEIPNLGDRSNAYVGYLLKRYILRMSDITPQQTTPGERPWLVVYSILSFFYRIFITVGILFFIAGKFFVVGGLLAVWAAISMVVVPFAKAVRRLFAEMAQTNKGTGPVIVLGGAFVVLLLAFILWWPLPSFTLTEGVIWVPEESQVFSGTDGFIAKVLVRSGSRVVRGDALVLCDSPDLKAETKVLEASLAEAETRLRVSLATDRTGADKLREEIAQVQAKLERARERASEMMVRSPAAGLFILPDAQDWPGRFVRRGAPIGYVVDFSQTIVRVIVNQADIDHIRHRTKTVEGRLAESPAVVFPALIRREVPAASAELPSMALSLQGGGRIALDPRENSTAVAPKAFEKLFHFDIEVPGATFTGIGERVYVRFSHDPESLGSRVHRSVRRLFLRRLNV
jgi:putative peptide zinc metalloprotease protein